MWENRDFPPEGLQQPSPVSFTDLKEAVESGKILEASVLRCTPDFSLHVPLGKVRGIIPRQDVNAPWINGAQRDISILSNVGKQICFTVKNVSTDEKGAPVAVLSRAEAQEKAMDFFLEHLQSGMILSCRVTHLAPFGAFLDIGCGVVAMLPIELICVSRLSHSKDRFCKGQKILAAVKDFDRENRRITMTHRELLGTWMENASRFHVGETVQGIVRSIKDYGCFVELSPNLSGLAENCCSLSAGDRVSVYIKNIRPEGMKVKLQIIEKLPPADERTPLNYQITDGRLERWVYSPPNCKKDVIETVFTASAP